MSRKSKLAGMMEAIETLATTDTPFENSEIADEPIVISLDKIHRWEDQPRQYFSEKSVSQLSASFRKHGFKGTLVVRPHPEIELEYQLIAGERRYRAASQAELVNVLCFVGNFTDAEALDFALGENLHREDLTKLEETLGILRLIETRHSISQEIAIEIINTEGHNDRATRSNVTTSKGQGDISEEIILITSVLNEFGIELQTFRTAHLPTLKLPEPLKKAHLEENLSYLAAKAIARIKDPEAQEALLQESLSDSLSVRNVRDRVQDILQTLPGKTSAKVVKVGSPENELVELKAVVAQLSRSKKMIVSDPVKMKKMKRILAQLKDLLPPENA